MVNKAANLIILLILLVLLQNAYASVIFDGKTWYDSHLPSTMSINSNGQLYQRDSLATGQPFCGSIDQFHIYNYALSQDEIVYLANNGPSVITYPLDSQADLNNDDIVDFRDYDDFASQWFKSCK